MKNNTKRLSRSSFVYPRVILLLTLAMALALVLCACGSKGTNTDNGSASSSDSSATSDETTSALANRLRGEGESVSPGQDSESDRTSSASAGSDDGVLLREDGEGLISLRIENGQAELVYDLDRWEKLHDIYGNAYYPVEEINEGPFTIVTAKGGQIKDACIGKIDDPFEGYLSLRDFITPTVAMLMEDGSVEFLRADPYMGVYMFGDTSIYSHGRLPWLKDIVALSYENEKDGIGGMSIFAQDRNGLLYNIQRLYTMVSVFDEAWMFRLDQEGSPAWRYCTLQLFETNHKVSFETGLNDGWGIWDYGIYEGSYEISLAENAPDSRRPGLITFDLTMKSGDAQQEKIVGTYFFQCRDGITMELWHSDGDHLAFMDDTPLTDFFFFRSGDPEYDFWGSEYEGESDGNDGYGEDFPFDDKIVIVTAWNDEGLAELFDDPKFIYFGLAGYTNRTMINYLLYSVPEARERVQRLGMAALCYGEVTVLDGAGLCRDVFLGTNRQDQFTKEIHYTITEGGDIYEYDPVEDRYYLVHSVVPGVG